MLMTNPGAKLNHLSFPSSDVPATSEFFQKYLGFTLSMEYEGAHVIKCPGFDVVIDRVDTGFVPLAADYVPEYPPNFHFGIELPTFSDLQNAYDFFKTEGVQLETDIFNNVGRGSRFMCRAPGGVLIEIVTRDDSGGKFAGTFDN